MLGKFLVQARGNGAYNACDQGPSTADHAEVTQIHVKHCMALCIVAACAWLDVLFNMLQTSQRACVATLFGLQGDPHSMKSPSDNIEQVSIISPERLERNYASLPGRLAGNHAVVASH